MADNNLTAIERYVQNNQDVSFSEEQQEANQAAESDTEPGTSTSVGRIDDQVNQGSSNDSDGGGDDGIVGGVSETAGDVASDIEETGSDTDSTPSPPETGPGGIPVGPEVGNRGTSSDEQTTESAPDPAPTPSPDTDTTDSDTPDAPETGPGGIPVGPTVGNQGTSTDEQTSTDPTPSPDTTTTTTGSEPDTDPTPTAPTDTGQDTTPSPSTDTTESSTGETQDGANIPIPSDAEASVVGRFQDAPSNEVVRQIQEGAADDRQVFKTTRNGETLFLTAESQSDVQGLLNTNVKQTVVSNTPGLDERSDVQVDDGQVTTTEQGQEDLEQRRRQQQAQAFDEQFSGVDVSVNDLVDTSDGPTLDLQTKRQIVASQNNVDVSKVTFTGDGFQIEQPDSEQSEMQQTLDARALIGGTTPSQRTTVRMNNPVLNARSEIGGTTPAERAEVAALGEQEVSGQFEARGEIGGTTPRERSVVDAMGEIEENIEEETGADLEPGDIEYSQEDGRVSGRLTEEGAESVEVQNTFGADIPIVGGITTTGTKVRQDVRDVTDPVAEKFTESTPSQEDVYGLVGAAAPVAALEPTPIGETGLAVVTGGALVGGALYQEGGALTGDDPTADASVSIGAIQPDELDAPSEPQDTSGELEPGEDTARQNEITVPEERTTVSPEELGIPRDAVRNDNAEITGPDGTDITDEGDIVIPADTTQVARRTRFDDEEEEAEDGEEEAEEEEEDRVVVDVPEEFIPEEEQTIGNVEESTEETEETSEEEEAQAPEEIQDPLEVPDQQQGTEAAEPEETQADEDFAEQPQRVQEPEVDTEQPDSVVDRTFDDVLNAGRPSGSTLPFVGGTEREETRQEEAQQPFVGFGPDTQPQQPQQQPQQQPEQTQTPRTVQNPVLDQPAAQQTDVQAQQQGLQLGQVLNLNLQENQAFEQSTPTENATPNENVVENEFGYPNPTVTQNTPTEAPPDTELPFPGFDGDDDDEENGFGVTDAPILTDFLNPVTGQRLETTEDPADEATFPGFFDPQE